MESLNKNYIKSVLTRLSGHNLLSGSVSECMCKLYDINSILPVCDEVLKGCHGLNRKHGLYLQCCEEIHEGELCKKCTAKASNSSYGKPPHGLIEERIGKGPDYIAPDGNKAVSFANVAEELGINLEDAEYYAESLGLTIPEAELVYKEKKRGRPKKEKKENNEPAKKRGRPKKEEIIQSQDDLIAEMASQIEMEYNTTEESVSKKNDEEDKKVEKERIKAEKDLEKAERKEEKERIKAEKDLEKKRKKEEKERIKAEKDLEKKSKKEEKERIKVEKNEEKERIKSEKESKFIDSSGESLNIDIKDITPGQTLTSVNSGESKTGILCSTNEIDDKDIKCDQTSENKTDVKDEDNELIDGTTIMLAEGFPGVVTRIKNVQYIITDGFPGDESEEKEKIVWLYSVGEVESIGELSGLEIELY